jgi:hypothetical protein
MVDQAILIRADKEFVAMIRKMKTEFKDKQGLALSDVNITKMICKAIDPNALNWEFNVGRWKFKIR